MEIPPWYHDCTRMLRPGTGINDPLCATQFLFSSWMAGILKYDGRTIFLSYDLEDCIAAPRHGIGQTAMRCAAATPLVGEQNRLTVIGEVSRVPEGEVTIGYSIETCRLLRITDVQQDSVARTGAGHHVHRLEHGQVMASARRRGGLGVVAVRAALPQTVDRASGGIAEDVGAGDHLGLLGVGQAAP